MSVAEEVGTAWWPSRYGAGDELGSLNEVESVNVLVATGLVRRGMVFVPFHWGDLYGEGNAANYLTISAIGRVAKQPELKFCAISLEKIPASVLPAKPGARGAREEVLAGGERPGGTTEQPTPDESCICEVS